MLQGDIELRNVKFRYPARKEAKIFDGLNLSIQVNRKVCNSKICGKFLWFLTTFCKGKGFDIISKSDEKFVAGWSDGCTGW